MATDQRPSALTSVPALRLTPLTSALRAARAHDAVLRMGTSIIPRSALALHQDSQGYFGTLSKLSWG